MTRASKSGFLDLLLQPFTHITYSVRAVFRAEKAAHTIASLLTLNCRHHASVELHVSACVQERHIPTRLYATVHTAGGSRGTSCQPAGKRSCKWFTANHDNQDRLVSSQSFNMRLGPKMNMSGTRSIDIWVSVRTALRHMLACLHLELLRRSNCCQSPCEKRNGRGVRCILDKSLVAQDEKLMRKSLNCRPAS